MEGVWYKVSLFLSALAVLAVLHASTSGGPPAFVEHARQAGGSDDRLMMDEDAGKDEETNGQEQEEELSDDITFLFAIIDMNRRTHMGIENYTFEKDYLEEVKKFLHTYRPEKMQIIIQRKYRPHIEDLLYEGVHVRYVEVEDLRAWRYYEPIERIRTSDWWSKNTGWLPEVPQGYSDLYNPIVMHKLLWLRDLSVLNPFKTKYFVWLDSGGICTPRIAPDYGLSIPDFKSKVKNYMDKLFMAVTPYAMSHELHGCYRAAMQKITFDVSPCFITKGWIMGGQRKYLEKVSNLYEYILNKTLDYGCLGTEETLLTMAYYRRPDLFHIHHNLEDRSNPFGPGGDVCHVIWPGVPHQGIPETPAHKFLQP